MILKLLKDKSVVEKLEHFANVANEMSSKLIVKDDIVDDYNVNRNNLKVFLSLIGILHQHYSDEKDPMAGISIIENDMDELQNSLWKLQDESEVHDKFKVEYEEKMYNAQKEYDSQDESRVDYEEKMYDAQKEMDKYEEKVHDAQKEMWNAQKERDKQDELRVEYEKKMWDSQKERDILNEKIYSGYEKLEIKLNKIKVWLDSLDPAHKQWVVDNFLTDNIKKKIFELEKKYG